MKKIIILLLLAFTAAIAFQACKTKEKTVEKNINKTISISDTIQNSDIKTVIVKKNIIDTNNIVNIKSNITTGNVKNDTINPEKIPVMNPKIHPYVMVDSYEFSENEDVSTPRYKTTELSNFNPFLESMYPGTKWVHLKNENLNCYQALYKGADFSETYVNSFVYYFYDIGGISHSDLIKTAILWILLPRYSNIEVSKTKLYKQEKEKGYETFYKYYYTTGTINGEKLEVYTTIRNSQIYTFKALKSGIEIRQLISFI